MDNDNLVPQSRVQVMQIITFALIMGVTMFFGMALFIVYGQNDGQPPAEHPLLSYIAAALGISNFFVAGLMPGMIQRNGLKNLARDKPNPAADAERLLGIKQTSLLVGQAMLEGTSFLGLIAFLVERQPFILFLVGTAMLMMLTTFPVRDRVVMWVERQLAMLDEMRARGDA